MSVVEQQGDFQSRRDFFLLLSNGLSHRCDLGFFLVAPLRNWSHSRALRQEYLPILQNRRKWNSTQPEIQEGDLILLKDDQNPRNKWPMALVSKVFASADGRESKVQLKVSKSGSGKYVTYLRPITEVICLLSKDS